MTTFASVPTQRLCFALDLKKGDAIAMRYDAMHAAGQMPISVNENLRNAGVVSMEIWRVANRLMMICEVKSNFNGFGQADADDPVVRQWDIDTAALQQAIFGTDSDGWAEMTRVYNLADQP